MIIERGIKVRNHAQAEKPLRRNLLVAAQTPRRRPAIASSQEKQRHGVGRFVPEKVSAAGGLQPPAWVTSEPEGPSEDALLARIESSHEAQERELMEQDPELALQVKLHNRMQHAALISNMMNMQHETSMAIIKNIKY